MAAPWAQAIGRLRCMVQGCCHGRKTNEFIGVKVHDEKSRICALSGLKGIPVHNTQLYSIISNVVCGLILFRLWYGLMPAPFIAGMYLIINGLTRFVEEAYRGETQTKIIGDLKIYQWLALVSVLIGIGFTMIPLPSYQMIPLITSQLVWVSLGLALFTGFAMGIDFPESNRRFSRLSG